MDDRAIPPPSNEPLGPIVDRLLTRRRLLTGGSAALAWTVLGARLARAGDRPARAATTTLDFDDVPRARATGSAVAEGYRADVLIRWGDPVVTGAPPFDVAAQTPAAQARQFGFNNDFVAWFPLPRGSTSSDHGLLVVNHEYTDPRLMFDDRERTPAHARRHADVELAAQGMSVLEVRRAGGRWAVVPDSRYARRLTALATEMALAGPAAGHPRLVTRDDPTGRRVVGTLNNCGGGQTPWGTALSCEENVDRCFGGVLAHEAERANHAAMGIPAGDVQGWGVHHPRFDVGREPNEPNRFGWVVEVDPYDPASVPVKRTALGRFKHEAATTVVAPDGRVVVYLADDEAFQYVYRYVSRAPYDPATTRDPGGLLDDGVLAVARFSDDGSLTWLPLVHGTGPLTPAHGFASPADVLVETRRAATLVGGTPLDRPEDVETDPVTGRVYVLLTKNKDRVRTDGANPRAANLFGHVLELTPPPGPTGRPDPTATRYAYDVFLRAGDPAVPAHGASMHPDTGPGGWLLNPDNCAFDPKGRLWIATDGAVDHGLADGLYGCDTLGPGRALTRMLYATPAGAELCGPCFTPDGTTIFVAVQHPGEGSGWRFPSTRWPDFDPSMPPRPSIVAIQRVAGGPIGG